MEIRKIFKFEAAHVVRKAWSQRCSKNIHGHSYIVEVFFGSDEDVPLGNGGMIVDFGIMKQYGNDFIDSFDHSLMLWDLPEERDIIKFAKANFERVVITAFPTSAEYQAAMFYTYFAELLQELQKTLPKDVPEDVYVSRVIVHETATGKAEYNRRDSENNIMPINLSKILFSPGIKAEWKTADITNKILKKG
jgi:6-pyruvoyltetrahydropterin/6-carboxytetrahydropterin synthase